MMTDDRVGGPLILPEKRILWLAASWRSINKVALSGPKGKIEERLEEGSSSGLLLFEMCADRPWPRPHGTKYEYGEESGDWTGDIIARSDDTAFTYSNTLSSLIVDKYFVV